MKLYCVVYLNYYGIHCRYRCSAQNKREARIMCCNAMGCRWKDITEVYSED